MVNECDPEENDERVDPDEKNAKTVDVVITCCPWCGSEEMEVYTLRRTAVAGPKSYTANCSQCDMVGMQVILDKKLPTEDYIAWRNRILRSPE
jgi:hypothetical protein